MTCSCGKEMCYLCRERVSGYDHFYGQVCTRCMCVSFTEQGGEPTAVKKCPLWSDTKVVHQAELARVAQEARRELAQTRVTFEKDPLQDIPVPDVQETVEVVRSALFQRWAKLASEVAKLLNPVLRDRMVEKLDAVLLQLQDLEQAVDLVSEKAKILKQIVEYERLIVSYQPERNIVPRPGPEAGRAPQ